MYLGSNRDKDVALAADIFGRTIMRLLDPSLTREQRQLESFPPYNIKLYRGTLSPTCASKNVPSSLNLGGFFLYILVKSRRNHLESPLHKQGTASRQLSLKSSCHLWGAQFPDSNNGRRDLLPQTRRKHTLHPYCQNTEMPHGRKPSETEQTKQSHKSMWRGQIHNMINASPLQELQTLLVRQFRSVDRSGLPHC